jgi:hypothetical protein
MQTAWEQSWERHFLQERNGPTLWERWSALAAITVASIGFVITIVWTVVEALR